MSPHLVHRLESVEAARAVRRGIEYDPAPPVQDRAAGAPGSGPGSERAGQAL